MPILGVSHGRFENNQRTEKTMKTQLVVIGAGPGGYAAAFLAADLGMEVTLVDAGARLGGVCLLQGCIPSKALLHVAKTMADARHLADWGVAYGEPTIDLDAVRAKKQKVIDTLTAGLGQLAKRRKVKVVQARATFLDSSTLRLESTGGQPLEDDRLVFQHCILATGSSPAQIPALDLATGRVMDSTGGLALADVPDSLLVVGGGYIGLELGTVYAALGSRVSVVEMTDGLLPGADRDLVKPLSKRLAGRFEAVYLGTKVAALADCQDAVEVTFEGPSVAAGEEVKRFDRVLVAVGRRPNSAGLGLENTSVQIDKQGFVVVDDSQRSDDTNIMAIGDVVGEPMLAHKASHQGKVAVEVLAGQTTTSQPVTFQPAAIPAVVFTDPEIAWAGLTESRAKAEGREVAVAKFPWAASGRAQAVGRTEGLSKWIIDPQSERLLGCGIVGPGAGDLISEAVLAIEGGATVEDITTAIHPHPTFSETLAGAGEVHQGLATDLYRPKRKR